MKTKRTFTGYLVPASIIFAAIVFLQVFAGCQNPFEQSNSESGIRPPAGTGFFSFNFADVTLGRTILPATPSAGSFAVYKLEFLSGSTVVKTVDRSPANPSDPVTLEVGTYDLHVTAYLDAAKTKPAAWGSKTITITNGGTTTGSVELGAIKNTGQGTFKWTITFPSSSGITGSVKITPIAGTSGAEQTATLVNGTAGSIPLNAGYYRVVFTLQNATNESAVRWETLHIYQNMESAFSYNFESSQFHSYTTTSNTKVTNGNDSGAGSLRQAITDVPSGGTIEVESYVGTIRLQSRLTINKSVIIEGNGTTITRDPSWTTINSTSNFLYISGSSATVTIRRVHFKDGRVSDDSALLSWGSVNLESCIFSGNQNSSSVGGAIYSVGTLSVKGCTFYGNSSGASGGAIYSNNSLTLTGNLFYGNRNTASNYIPVVYSSAPTSTGYNVVDVQLGTGSAQSGWAGQSTDKTISSLPITPVNFKLLSGGGAQNVITSRPAGYPTVDFYGNSIPTTGAAAGAVQAVASGYLVEVSVNDSNLGNAVISGSAPNADGLYTGTVTLTATAAGQGSFLYWLVNDTQVNGSPLNLTLNNHNKVQAVFGKVSANSVQKVVFSGATETVTLSGLINESVYLVKVNTSGGTVSAANTGGPSGSSVSIASGNVLPAPDNGPVVRMGHPAADEYHANPRPILRNLPEAATGLSVLPFLMLLVLPSYSG